MCVSDSSHLLHQQTTQQRQKLQLRSWKEEPYLQTHMQELQSMEDKYSTCMKGRVSEHRDSMNYLFDKRASIMTKTEFDRDIGHGLEKRFWNIEESRQDTYMFNVHAVISVYNGSRLARQAS